MPQSARPRQNLRNIVNPCEICGFFISQKRDISRHAKTHATDDDDKLRCPMEGCEYRTLQKSNMVIHINRHTNTKPHCCTNCKFKTCDPASLFRHKKRLHGYIPRNSTANNFKKPVPISLMRGGIDLARDFPDYISMIGSQFSAFSFTEASTSPAASSSQSLSLPQTPLPSPIPTTLAPFPPSHSPSGHQSHVHSFPPSTAMNSFAGSEVLSSSTPIVTLSHHDFTPEGPSPTVLSTPVSYPVYAESQLYDHDSLIYAPPTDSEDYALPVDCPFTSTLEPWDFSVISSDESVILEYQQPEDVVFDTISGERELELIIPPPAVSSDHDVDPSWPGIETTVRLIGADGLPLPLDMQQPEAPSSSQVVEQHPIHVSPLNETHHLPIEDFRHNDSEYASDYPTHYQIYSAPSPLAIVPTSLDSCYQHYSTPSPQEMYTSPHDVSASLGYYDTVSLDGNNQKYHGFNTGLLLAPPSHVTGFANQDLFIWN